MKLAVKKVSLFSLIGISTFAVGCAPHIDLEITRGNINSKVSLKEVMCENPISLDAPELKPVLTVEELPQMAFRMKQIQIYHVSEKHHDSYSASLDESTGYSTKIDCNGVRQGNYENHANAPDWFDFQSLKKSVLHRKMKVEFVDGQLTSAFTKSYSVSEQTFERARYISQDRKQVGPDQYATYRIYISAANELDVRVRLENAADENGNREVSYARYVFRADDGK